MSEALSKKISIFSMIFLLTGLFFAYGLAVGSFQLWPYKTIKSAYSGFLSLVRYGEFIPPNRLVEVSDRISRERFKIFQADKIQSGYYAFMGYDGEKLTYIAWLLNDKGEQLHSWDLSYLTLDPDGPLNGIDAPHAFKVLPDASVLVSFDSGDVMAKVDQCSKPVWTKQGVFHHSIEKGLDNSYWTWRGDNTAYAHYNYLTNFNSDTGETIQEFELIDDLVKGTNTPANLFGIRADYSFKRFDKTPEDKVRIDLFHPNDIDILQPELADKFENFEAGDLLLSFRNNHLVAVVDPKTYEIKWARNGPWKYQHDPDFTEDGMISVYSNNSNYGRSEIIKIDPTTNEVKNELVNGDLFFYSDAQGKHQYLPNGNLLIVIPGEGRVVQVTADGNKVFEHNNISKIGIRYNEHISNAQWMGKNFFNSLPSCVTAQ
jgi:hypothetical protein